MATLRIHRNRYPCHATRAKAAAQKDRARASFSAILGRKERRSSPIVIAIGTQCAPLTCPRAGEVPEPAPLERSASRSARLAPRFLPWDTIACTVVKGFAQSSERSRSSMATGNPHDGDHPCQIAMLKRLEDELHPQVYFHRLTPTPSSVGNYGQVEVQG